MELHNYCNVLNRYVLFVRREFPIHLRSRRHATYLHKEPVLHRRRVRQQRVFAVISNAHQRLGAQSSVDNAKDRELYVINSG